MPKNNNDYYRKGVNETLLNFADEYGLKITSGTGGEHNKNSSHYSGGAIDIDHRNLGKFKTVEEMYSAAEKYGLNIRDERTRPAGQAVWKGGHFHIGLGTAGKNGKGTPTQAGVGTTRGVRDILAEGRSITDTAIDYAKQNQAQPFSWDNYLKPITDYSSKVQQEAIKNSTPDMVGNSFTETNKKLQPNGLISQIWDTVSNEVVSTVQDMGTSAGAYFSGKDPSKYTEAEKAAITRDQARGKAVGNFAIDTGKSLGVSVATATALTAGAPVAATLGASLGLGMGLDYISKSIRGEKYDVKESLFGSALDTFGAGALVGGGAFLAKKSMPKAAQLGVKLLTGASTPDEKLVTSMAANVSSQLIQSQIASKTILGRDQTAEEMGMNTLVGLGLPIGMKMFDNVLNKSTNNSLKPDVSPENPPIISPANIISDSEIPSVAFEANRGHETSKQLPEIAMMSPENRQKTLVQSRLEQSALNATTDATIINQVSKVDKTRKQIDLVTENLKAAVPESEVAIKNRDLLETLLKEDEVNTANLNKTYTETYGFPPEAHESIYAKQLEIIKSLNDGTLKPEDIQAKIKEARQTGDAIEYVIKGDEATSRLIAHDQAASQDELFNSNAITKTAFEVDSNSVESFRQRLLETPPEARSSGLVEILTQARGLEGLTQTGDTFFKKVIGGQDVNNKDYDNYTWAQLENFKKGIKKELIKAQKSTSPKAQNNIDKLTNQLKMVTGIEKLVKNDFKPVVIDNNVVPLVQEHFGNNSIITDLGNGTSEFKWKGYDENAKTLNAPNPLETARLKTDYHIEEVKNPVIQETYTNDIDSGANKYNFENKEAIAEAVQLLDENGANPIQTLFQDAGLMPEEVKEATRDLEEFLSVTEGGTKNVTLNPNVASTIDSLKTHFGLDDQQATANAIVIDSIMNQMAKRNGISVQEMYGLIDIVKSDPSSLVGKDKVLHQIIGERGAKFSEEVSKRLDSAKQLESSGIYTPQQIYYMTGWERNLEGLWEYDLIDRIDFEIIPTNGVLGDVMVNYNGFIAYPELKDVKIEFKDIKNKYDYGSFDAETNTITINKNTSLYDQHITILHEIQHKVQDIEGFSKGINTQYIKAKLEINYKRAEDLVTGFNKVKNTRQWKDAEYIERNAEVAYKSKLITEAEYQAKLKQADDTLRSNPNISKLLDDEDKFKRFFGLGSDEFLVKYPEKKNYVTDGRANNFYQSTYGEIQARVNEDRLKLTPEERRVTPITETIAKMRSVDPNSISFFREGVAEALMGVGTLAYNTKVPSGAKGAIQFLPDSKAIIHALTDPNASTPVHEFAHLYETVLTKDERIAIAKWAGAEKRDGKLVWNRSVSEKFARGFEKYLADGKAPNKYIRNLFKDFSNWLKDIYYGIKGSDIDLKLNKEMKKIYDQMLGSTDNPEVAIAYQNAKLVKKYGLDPNGNIKEQLETLKQNLIDKAQIKNTLDAYSTIYGVKFNEDYSVSTNQLGAKQVKSWFGLFQNAKDYMNDLFMQQNPDSIDPITGAPVSFETHFTYNETFYKNAKDAVATVKDLVKQNKVNLNDPRQLEAFATALAYNDTLKRLSMLQAAAENTGEKIPPMVLRHDMKNTFGTRLAGYMADPSAIHRASKIDGGLKKIVEGMNDKSPNFMFFRQFAQSLEKLETHVDQGRLSTTDKVLNKVLLKFGYDNYLNKVYQDNFRNPTVELGQRLGILKTVNTRGEIAKITSALIGAVQSSVLTSTGLNGFQAYAEGAGNIRMASFELEEMFNVNPHTELNDFSKSFLAERGYGRDFKNIWEQQVAAASGRKVNSESLRTTFTTHELNQLSESKFGTPIKSLADPLLALSDVVQGLPYRMAQAGLENEMGIMAARIAQGIFEKGGHSGKAAFEEIFDSVHAELKVKSMNANRAFIASHLVGGGGANLAAFVDLPTITNVIDGVISRMESTVSKIPVIGGIANEGLSMGLRGAQTSAFMFSGFIGEASAKQTKYWGELSKAVKDNKLTSKQAMIEAANGIAFVGLLGVSATSIGGYLTSILKVISSKEEGAEPNELQKLIDNANAYRLVFGDKYVNIDKLSLDSFDNMSMVINNLVSVTQLLPNAQTGEFKDRGILASRVKDMGNFARNVNNLLNKNEPLAGRIINTAESFSKMVWAGTTSNIRAGIAMTKGYQKIPSTESIYEFLTQPSEANIYLSGEEYAKMEEDMLYRMYKYGSVALGLRSDEMQKENEKWQTYTARAVKKGDIAGAISSAKSELFQETQLE